MVDITPGTALLAALQNQFNAARQGQGQGTNSLIPGFAGSGEGADPSSILSALGGGISAGGVPGTATTGSSIANSLIGGSAGAGDPLAQQVSLASGLGFREGGERGDLGAGVTGGDIGMLLSTLGPLAPLMLLGQIVSSADAVAGGHTFLGSPLQLDAPVSVAPDFGGGGVVNTIRGGVGPFGPISETSGGFNELNRELTRESTTGRVSGPV